MTPWKKIDAKRMLLGDGTLRSGLIAMTTSGDGSLQESLESDQGHRAGWGGDGGERG